MSRKMKRTIVLLIIILIILLLVLAYLYFKVNQSKFIKPVAKDLVQTSIKDTIKRNSKSNLNKDVNLSSKEQKELDEIYDDLDEVGILDSIIDNSDIDFSVDGNVSVAIPNPEQVIKVLDDNVDFDVSSITSVDEARQKFDKKTIERIAPKVIKSLNENNSSKTSYKYNIAEILKK